MKQRANVPLGPLPAVTKSRRGGAILSTSALGYTYNGSPRPALRGLTLAIEEGRITAILGPNGSGKTTLLRLLLGALHPTQGTVHLAGRELGTYSRRERGQWLGLVPQDERIAFDFSVLEYVLLGRAPYLGPLATPGPQDGQVALQALHMAGLDELYERNLPTLSGGERQLAVVARALAQQPRILLMDEPAAHLDLGNQGRLLGIMRDLVAAGTTLVLTTHDPNLAATIAGEVVLMRGGRVLASGPAPSLLTAEYLSATYEFPVEVIEVGDRRVCLLP